jgi:glycosyltransferase involved in cell wall biosynthesis
MLCGRPVVATAVGLSREQIEDGKTGFIAEAATLPLLLNALDKVWQRKADWSDMGTHGYYRAIKQTDHNSHINLLARIIAYSKEQPSETQ